MALPASWLQRIFLLNFRELKPPERVAGKPCHYCSCSCYWVAPILFIIILYICCASCVLEIASYRSDHCTNLEFKGKNKLLFWACKQYTSGYLSVFYVRFTCSSELWFEEQKVRSGVSYESYCALSSWVTSWEANIASTAPTHLLI